MSTTAETDRQLPRSYSPADHEAEITARWLDAGLFHADATDDDRPRYCILIPPPNVTAALHLGHAFNNSVQDVLVRHHRMRGANTLWMPGTDHAGIATQTVVEKRLLTVGKRRLDFSRDAFVERVQAWKDEYEATITSQLKAMGASCDWDRQRFTMDPICAAAVREAFFRLFRDDLIYRGKRLVNWDPVTLTALADDEVEMKEVEGSFWYLKYPVVDDAGNDTGEFLTVATTRPETMLGDTAVAVNPDDPERAAYIGKRLRLPIVGRIIPVIGDDYVVRPDPNSDDAKAQYASGFLKVTPAHDPNDWEIGRRHELEAINVMAPDGSISASHGWEDVSDDARAFVGMSREEARAAIVQWFADHDLLAEVREYAHSVGHSYRSHVPVEPYLSDQWYVRVTDDRLVGEAQRALHPDQFDGTAPARTSGAVDGDGDGDLQFFPARYAHSYQSWHDNLRDWCISRQLWWGHRIPVWHAMFDTEIEANATWDQWAADAELHPEHVALRREVTPDGVSIQLCFGRECDTVRDLITRAETDGFRQDEDVLDTWFSSGLWPLNTMGWPDPDQDAMTRGVLDRFNPSSVLCTGRDIITLWVSRMVMFNRYFNDGKLPFRHVYINPMIQDGHGQRMSKSLGNGVDPRDIIHSHGADALRYTLLQMATATQDVRLPVDMVSPYSGESFTPKETVSPAGYRVAAPEQTCPQTGKPMVSGYGVASGAVTATDDAPLARNTSARFDIGRNFCNKLWNATGFALTHLDHGSAGADLDPATVSVVDRWMLARAAHAIRDVTAALEQYQFAECVNLLFRFIKNDLCDWYIEATKPTIREDAAQRQVLRTVLDVALRLLHPICPFVTEVLWSRVRQYGLGGVRGLALPNASMLAAAAWPTVDDAVIDAAAHARFEQVQQLVGSIRTLRSEHQVAPKRRITLHATPAVVGLVEDAGPVIPALAGLDAVVAIDGDRPDGAVPLPFEGDDLLLSGLVDAVDKNAEQERLNGLIASLEKEIAQLNGRLANPGYVEKAPAALVEQTRGQLADKERDLEAARRALTDLG